MDKKQLTEEAMKKFMQLDALAREFVLGYVSGKRDERQTDK